MHFPPNKDGFSKGFLPIFKDKSVEEGIEGGCRILSLSVAFGFGASGSDGQAEPHRVLAFVQWLVQCN